MTLQIGANDSRTGSKSSKCLIFHVHGGGFASQTSKSHEPYLLEWAAKLDVPMVSVDYTLSTEGPFPRALEEVFYAYCWVLKNPELVGSTGENVVFVGDSAGANLITACAIKCIEVGVRKPKAIVDIYAAFWIGFNLSPARFMACFDTVLPFALTSRLCKSYAQKPEPVNGDESSDKAESGKKKRKRYESFAEMFSTNMQESYLISPYLAPDSLLAELPTIKIVAATLDPCLDDSIEFAKKMKNLKVDVELKVLNGLPHGFLYLSPVSSNHYGLPSSKVPLSNIAHPGYYLGILKIFCKTFIKRGKISRFLANLNRTPEGYN